LISGVVLALQPGPVPLLNCVGWPSA